MLEFKARGIAGREKLGDLPLWLSNILRTRGVDTPEKAEAFLHPSLDRLYDPYLMQDMDKCVAILRAAALNGTPIVVYGDYDTDGVSATTIMVETLREMGAEVTYRLPSRHTEGYGLHEKTVREMAKTARVLVTVDCGISNVEEVKLAKMLGMTVIVTDHHQLPETLPQADAVLNPLLGSYPFRRLCGAGVALKITQALLGMDAVKRCVDVAALATIADIVPLIDENRVIVKAGLAAMGENRRPGLEALLTVCGVKKPVTAGRVSFSIAPRLNAGGRLEGAEQGVQLLLTQDTQEAETLAAHLEENNRIRQGIEQETLDEALRQVEETMDFRNDRMIIVTGENWNSGIIGLTAGRLTERYHWPSIVLSVNPEKGEAVGSCRSVEGVNMHAALTSCHDLFIRFGGHEMAAGLTIPTERIPELKRRLNLYVNENCDLRCYIPVKEYDAALTLDQVTLDMISSLDQLQPTGYGNPAPLFLVEDVNVQEMRRVGADRSHLKLTVVDAAGSVAGGIAFRKGEHANTGLTRIDLIFEPERNEYLGKVTPQLNVKELRTAVGSVRLPETWAFLRAVTDAAQQLSSFAEAETPTVKPLTRARLERLAENGHGTLIICHEPELAKALAVTLRAELVERQVTDCRGFNTILCAPDYAALRDVWERIVLADGDVLPGQAAWLQKCCLRAELFALGKNTALTASLKELLLTDELQRSLYLNIRNRIPLSLDMLGEALGMTTAQTDAALQAMAQVGLAEYKREPFSVRLLARDRADRRAPLDSVLMRYLQTI